MRMCQLHWEELRKSIDGYGLSHLIAPDGQAAVELLKKRFAGDETPLNFDPLMSANNMLWETSVNFIGLKMMDGDRCPSCELRDYNWTEGAAYQARLYCEKNGLLLEPPGEVSRD